MFEGKKNLILGMLGSLTKPKKKKTRTTTKEF